MDPPIKAMKSTFTPDEAQGRCDLTWPLMENTKKMILWICKLCRISKMIGERKYEGVNKNSVMSPKIEKKFIRLVKTTYAGHYLNLWNVA